MTDEEFAKIEASIDEVEEWWNNLSDEDRKKEAEKSKDTRLWEDWTDCDPVTNAKPRSSQKQSDR